MRERGRERERENDIYIYIKTGTTRRDTQRGGGRETERIIYI